MPQVYLAESVIAQKWLGVSGMDGWSVASRACSPIVSRLSRNAMVSDGLTGLQQMFQHQPLMLLGVVLILGFYFGNLVRKGRLPSIIGFMLLGVLLGPSLLGWFDGGNGEGNLETLAFITEVSLGLVAFTIGSELKLRGLKQLGRGIVWVIFAESLVAFAVVMLAVYSLTGSWPMALLFGAVAPASAPAGTVAVIKEYRAQGRLTQALYAVVGFDDGLAILIFGFAAALAKTLLLGHLHLQGASVGIVTAMLEPAGEIVLSLVVGAVLGFVFCQLVRKLRERRDMLIMVFGTVLLATGVAMAFHLSLILTNMVVGFILVNTRREALVHQVNAPLHDVLGLMFILFFTLAGAHLDLSALPQLGLLGAAYIVARSAGLVGGARLGGFLGRVDPKIGKWIGLGILSQAGVAIGLSLMVSQDFRRLAETPRVAEAVEKLPAAEQVLYDPLAIGGALITTITATCIVFEIVGPILTKLALHRAGEIPPTPTPAGSGGEAR
ncbi:MAG: cation:proton antiporter [Pirellulaceae bacterium]